MNLPLPHDLFSDPRFLNLPAPAMALVTRAASWSAMHLTDGHVPMSALPLFGCAEDGPEVAALLDEGIWKRPRSGGYQFVDWPASSRRDSVERRRALDRHRKRQKRQKGRMSAADTTADTENPSASPVLSAADTTADIAADADGGDSGDARDTGDNDDHENPSSDGRLPFEDLSGAVSAADPPAPPENPTEPPTGVPPGSLYEKSKDFSQRPGKTKINEEKNEKINTGTIVAAWVDAYREHVHVSPAVREKSQVGREARHLLTEDADPALVLKAAQDVGALGFSTLKRQYAPMKAKLTKAAADERRDPKTGRLTSELPW